MDNPESVLSCLVASRFSALNKGYASIMSLPPKANTSQTRREPQPDRPLNADQLTEWFWKRIPKQSLEHFPDNDWGLCQCGTEKLIARCRDNANQMRTFLLVSVFIDQMTYAQFSQAYQRFRERFRFPKLNSHGGSGMARPSWLVYSRHGYDKLMDWETARPIAKMLFVEYLIYLQSEPGVDGALNGFLKVAEKKISAEFDVKAGQLLREVISSAVDEANQPAPIDQNNENDQHPLYI